MYVQEKLDDDYYDFLVHRVRPALKECDTQMSHQKIYEKRRVLELMGIDVVEIIPVSRFLEKEFVPVDRCTDYEIHTAVSQVRHRVNDYMSKFHERKRAQELEEIQNAQLTFDFRNGIECGPGGHLQNTLTSTQRRAQIIKMYRPRRS